MKKENLENRINQITKEIESALGIYHKLNGHLAEAKFMLEELNKEEVDQKAVDDNQNYTAQAPVCN